MRDWLTLLRAEVERTSRAAAARRIGASRPAVSMVLSGSYGARTTRVEAKVLQALGQADCPHLGRVLMPDECAGYCSRPMPTGSRAEFRHWQACQNCKHNENGGDNAEP